MKRFHRILAGGILFASCLSALAPIDEGKPYGRVCFSVIQTAPEPEEESFRPGLQPGPNKRIVAHMDSNTSCHVLIAAFTEKEGELANAWMPQFLGMRMWEEVKLPRPPAKWAWTQASNPFKFYVLFLADESKLGSEIKELVAAMQNVNANSRLLRAQTQKLHELVGHAMASLDKGKREAAMQPALVGGIFRGTDFPWRQFSQKINFSEAEPGVLIFPSSLPPGSDRSPHPPGKKN